jgi:hypothetical protein
MIYLVLAALAVFGGISYAGWQHGYWDCMVEQYLLGGLAACYLLAVAAGKLCRKLFPEDEDDGSKS